jgi:hypothetical protein
MIKKWAQIVAMVTQQKRQLQHLNNVRVLQKKVQDARKEQQIQTDAVTYINNLKRRK